MTSRATSRWLLIAAAALFSTGGAAIKAPALTPWQVAGLRSTIAALTLALLIPSARRGWTWRTGVVAAAYAATLLLFVLANRMTTSANATFLQSTAPLYLLLIGPLALREPILRADGLFAAVVGGGLVLFFVAREAAAATAPNPFRGNVLAVISGFTWALSVAGLRWLGRHKTDPGATGATIIAGNLLAACVALPMALPVSHISMRDTAVLVYLGVFQIGVAYWCLARGIRDVPAFEAATLMLIEPVLNPIWAWLVHGERPAAIALAGGAVILGATFVNTWRKSASGSSRR